MRTRNVIVGLFALAFVLGLGAVTAEAQNAICFQDQDQNVFRIETGPATGSFFLLGGQYVPSGGGARAPISGAAHLRQNGNGQLGFTIHSSNATDFPVVGQLTLTPPAFNSGTGSQDSLGGTFKALTVTPATCPAVQ
jgi:hypothetical protein